MARQHRRDRTEVSCVIKYLVFGFNVIFWLVGGMLAAAGIWAWSEKDMFNNISQVTKVTLDPALIFIIAGGIIFIIGFTGCVGALRENTCLLLFYCACLGIIFGAQLIVGILAFAYKDWVSDQVKNTLKEMVLLYRDDPDLQNLIDWVQMDWLKCCGVDTYNDWNDNIYFNCTSPSAERCGVPFSCCKKDPDAPIENKQCGYGVRDPSKTPNPADKIYVEGCLKAGEGWFNDNLIPVAGVVVALALIQILGICFAMNLRSDIMAQRAKWS